MLCRIGSFIVCFITMYIPPNLTILTILITILDYYLVLTATPPQETYYIVLILQLIDIK